MMNFFRKTKGAVSIFLIIILLPTLTVAGLFVDISRIKLSEEVANSSADLALNTLLTNYDKKLKDYFGLLGECQDAEEATEISKQFFTECMVSAGVDTTSAQKNAAKLINAVNGGTDFHDVLQLSVDTDVSIEPTPNSALSNPAVLKEQIVEFQKYRAPVNGILALIEKLKGSGAAEKAQNAPDESELTKARKEFYEAEEKLYDDAEEAYKNIKSFNNMKGCDGKKISDPEYLKGMAKYLSDPKGSGKTIRDIYKDAHKIIIKDLYPTHDSNGNKIELMKPVSPIQKETEEPFSDSHKATKEDLEKYIRRLGIEGTGYEDDIRYKYLGNSSNFMSVMNKNNDRIMNGDNGKLDIMYTTYGELGANYPLRYWAAITDTFSGSNEYNNYVSAARMAYKDYTTLVNAQLFPSPNVEVGLMEVTNAVIKQYDNYYIPQAFDPNSTQYKYGGYGELTELLKTVDTQQNRDLADEKRVDDIFVINGKIKNYVSDFDRIAGSNGYLTNAKKKLSDLRKDIKAYREALDYWEEVANRENLDDSEMAQEDRKTIKKLRKEGAPIREEDVDSLKEHVENILELSGQILKDLKGIEYGDAKEDGSKRKAAALSDLVSYKDIHLKALFIEDEIPFKEAEIDQYAEKHFYFSLQERLLHFEFVSGSKEGFLEDNKYVVSDLYAFDLTKPQNDVYDWMKKTFDGAPAGKPTNAKENGYDVGNDSDKDTNKKKGKDAKKDMNEKGKGEDEEDDSDSTSHSFSEWEDEWAKLPSKVEPVPVTGKGKKDLDNAAEVSKNVFGGFAGKINNAAVSARDDLFALDYAFEMFTYATFDYEGCYDLYTSDKNNTEKITTLNAKSKYDSVMKDWKASQKNKTLTLHTREPANNWCYGAEIEYILYGNKSNGTNKAIAATEIYLIRYAFNLAPVWQEYWNGCVPLEALAEALQAFAFIPTALTKTLAILAITAVESAFDLAAIKLGIPVILIKSKSDLTCSFDSVFCGADLLGSDDDDGKLKFQYSEYLMIFLFIKLIGDSENTVYKRMGDVIQANMSLQTTGLKAGVADSYDLSKAYTHYDLKADVLAAPMWTKLLSIYNLGDSITDKEWRTVSVEMTRGY